MAATDKLFAGAIPGLYDRYLVPLLFDEYARDLAGRVAALRPRNLLEIAAGTGALTGALVERLDPAARLVVSDLNQPMLDVAMEKIKDDRIEWQQADALALPFEADTFDVVACQFGVMFYLDKVQGYKETRRVLKEGGRFLFNVWDSLASNDFARALEEILAKLFAEDPPRFMSRVPHGYCDHSVIREELAAAGFPSVEIETVDRITTGPSAEVVAFTYCQGTPLRNEIEMRDPSGLESITQQVGEAFRLRFGDGPIEGGIRAHVITAAG